MGIFSKITVKCDKNYENYWIQFALKKIKEMQENGETYYCVSGYEQGSFRFIEINLDA